MELKTNISIGVGCATIGWLLVATASAHGVASTVTREQAVVVTVTYEDGTPLANQTYDVRAPGADEPRQLGRTDDCGRVVFLPHLAGEWRVRVTTADGHGAVVPVEIAADMLPANAASGGWGRNRLSKLVTGVALIFGVFGVVALVALRRK